MFKSDDFGGHGLKKRLSTYFYTFCVLCIGHATNWRRVFRKNTVQMLYFTTALLFQLDYHFPSAFLLHQKYRLENS
jgi:hypothetical protein